MATNPFTGASWGDNMINPQMFASPNSSSAPPPSSAGTNNLFGAPPPIATPNSGPTGNPGNLANPASNLKDAMRNAGFLNVIQGQLRDQLIPMFANLMTQYATPAANFAGNLMNLGSPYYQQKQEESFNQGVQQNQNAAGQARQQMDVQGYGGTPSGAEAAMIGGMNQAGSQNLATNYLQNLFQNENMQMQGASLLQQLAAMFNPSSLFGNVNVSGSTQGPSATDEFSKVLQGIFGSAGVGGTGIPVLGGQNQNG